MEDYKRGSHTARDRKDLGTWYEVVKRIRSAGEAELGAGFVGAGLLVATSGNVTDEVWKRYIEEQKPPSPDDDFNVV